MSEATSAGEERSRMGILDKLGLKKKESRKAEKKSDAAAVVNTGKKADEKEPGVVQKTEGPVVQNAYRILLKPIISEKGTALAGAGRYVFAVRLRSNKSEIKKSIQRIYNVDVESVRIIKVAGKFRRYGRSVGRTSTWKKAIVTVKKGQKIPGIIEAVG